MNYWSCSKLADKIRGTTKPYSETWEGWDDWHKTAKDDFPFRYWLVEEFFDDVQKFVNYIPGKINDVRYYLNNRFTTKTHALTSNLKKGQWYDFDTRILNCLFDELVNFVEVEKAWHYCMWSKDAQKKYAVPTFRKYWLLRWFREWRCPEAGVDYLKWEMTLTNEEYTHWLDQDYGTPTLQAIAAKEQLELYEWWKNIRPNRPDPYDISGWSAYCDSRRSNEDNLFSYFNDKTPEEQKKTSKLLDVLHHIEKEYDDEDEKMMIRLIKVRQSMWT